MLKFSHECVTILTSMYNYRYMDNVATNALILQLHNRRIEFSKGD